MKYYSFYKQLPLLSFTQFHASAHTRETKCCDMSFKIICTDKSRKINQSAPLRRKDVCEKINNTLCTLQTMLPATQYPLCRRPGDHVCVAGRKASGTCAPRSASSAAAAQVDVALRGSFRSFCTALRDLEHAQIDRFN